MHPVQCQKCGGSLVGLHGAEIRTARTPGNPQGLFEVRCPRCGKEHYFRPTAEAAQDPTTLAARAHFVAKRAHKAGLTTETARHWVSSNQAEWQRTKRQGRHD